MRVRWRWIVGAIALLIVVFLAFGFANEPLRRRVEGQMNASLDGYTVWIRELRFHPLGFSIDLVDWVVVQDASPDPPVAYIPKLHASVEWKALLHGGLVADFRFDRPEFYVDLWRATQEANDQKGVEERGWQEAAFAVYPLKINLVRVNDGKFTYVDKGPLKPLRISNIDFRAGNIRNVRSRERDYPSEVHFSGNVLDSANVRVDGHADFLAVPYSAIKAKFDLGRLRLDYLEPILHHYDLAVGGGTLGARGEVEYGPKVKAVRLDEATLDRADVTYVKRRPEQPTPGEKAGQAAAKITQQPEIAVHADRIKIADGTLAYSNETTDPPYRLFVNDCNLTVTDFTNVRGREGNGTGKAEATGKFMGSGDTEAHATFWPRADRTDFNASLRIDNADLRALNDLWRAYGKFDVQSGTFSLYSELKVEKGEIDGYVKPIFYEMDVFDADEKKGIGQKVYEGIVGGVATMFTNHPRDEVATKTSLSGRLENPQTSILEVFARLTQNAFFKAILPGLEEHRGGKRD